MLSRQIKHCPKCNKDKSIQSFCSSTRNNYCKLCMAKYLRVYRSPRLEFNATLLSEKDMDKEMKSRKRINPKGLNALIDLSKKIESMSRSIKSFTNSKAKSPIQKTIGFKTQIY